MATPVGDDADQEIGWGVGSVAARLGISASTLRTWERRYDVGPSRRTAGGHRRYSEADIERVELTQLLIARGAPPSDAARVAHSLTEHELASALGSEHGRSRPEPAQPAEVVPAMRDAALADDPRRIARLVTDALRAHGTVRAWTDILVPVLVQIGRDWSAGSFRVETEHLTSDAITKALRAHVHRLGEPGEEGPVIVLASAEDEQHVLPVYAVEAALADIEVSTLVLGARLPTQSLADLIARVRPRIVYLWASLPRSADDPIWDVLGATGDETIVILGGPGWPPKSSADNRLERAIVPSDLASTIQAVVDVLALPTHR